MAVVIQPRPIFIVALLGLATVSGCQGGIGRLWDGLASKTNALSRSNDHDASQRESNIPTPEISGHNFAQVQVTMGDSLAKEGKFEAAKAAYEAAIRNDDSLARPYHRLALLHEKIGNGSDSKELFLRAMKLDPTNAEIVCDYGYWCYLRQDWEESKKQLQLAVKLDPSLKRAHNNLGLVYARMKRPDDALKHFALAGLSPADGRANLGFVYLTQQRIPEAKVELERAVAASPSSEKARGVLASLDKKVTTTNEPKRLPSATASAPAAQPATNHQTNLGPADITEAPFPLAMLSKPTEDLSIKRPTNMHALPNHTIAPALANNPFNDMGMESASAVELTDFADRLSAVSTVSSDKPSPRSEPTIRFLPPR